MIFTFGDCAAWESKVYLPGLPLGLRQAPLLCRLTAMPWGQVLCGYHGSDHQQPRYDLCPSGAFGLVLVRREHRIPSESADKGASWAIAGGRVGEVKGRR